MKGERAPEIVGLSWIWGRRMVERDKRKTYDIDGSLKISGRNQTKN
jgi:hypothetical protein